MRKYVSLAAAAAVLVMAMPLAAEAFPIATAPAVASDSGLTLVAGGCGPAFHRGPLGGCRMNRVIVRRPILRRRVVCRVVGLIPHRVCRRF